MRYTHPDSAFVWTPREPIIESGPPKCLAITHATRVKQKRREEAKAPPAPTASAPCEDELPAEPVEGPEYLRKHQARDKSFERLRLFHDHHGHRSSEHTARMYEVVAGFKLPSYVIANQPRCESCDVAKISSKPYQKKRVMPIIDVGSDISADTIVSMCRSPSGFQHIAHVHDIK